MIYTTFDNMILVFVMNIFFFNLLYLFGINLNVY